MTPNTGAAVRYVQPSAFNLLFSVRVPLGFRVVFSVFTGESSTEPITEMKSRQSEKTSSVSFSVRLHGEMEKWNLSQTAIARRLGISQGTVSGWFNEGAVPHRRTLAAIADLLGVRPEWLLFGTEPKLNERSADAGEQIVASFPVIENRTVIAPETQNADSHPERVRMELRRQFDRTLAAAGEDRDRLGWIKVQLEAHVSPPAAWSILEQQNARADEILRQHRASEAHAATTRRQA